MHTCYGIISSRQSAHLAATSKTVTAGKHHISTGSLT